MVILVIFCRISKRTLEQQQQPQHHQQHSNKQQPQQAAGLSGVFGMFILFSRDVVMISMMFRMINFWVHKPRS